MIWLVFALLPASLPAVDWRPVTQQDLRSKPVVDANADAEALFWEISLADSAVNNQYPHTTYSHYLRIKIFTERGVKQFGTIDLEYGNKRSISNLAARTIQADGSIQDVRSDAIFDRVAAKGRGRKYRTRSFAMPNVKPGCIVEYKWQENREDELANYVRLPGQRDIPVQEMVYRVKPLIHPYFPYRMRYLPFNVDLPPFEIERDGYFKATVKNVPAYEEEADAPPSEQVRAWVLIYYEEDRKENMDKFWRTEGKRLYDRNKVRIKVNGDVKALAAKITAGAATPEEQVQKIYAYCQNQLKDLSGSEVTEEDRSGIKANSTSIDTLKRGIGTSADIQAAFAALATAAGFESRIAYLPERDWLFFRKELTTSYFLPGTDVAVKIDGKWKLYDPTSRYVEPGRLRWQEQGVTALITDEKNPEWVETPIDKPAFSQEKRTGQLRLAADGSLEGSLTETLTGAPAAEWRQENQHRTASEREDEFRRDMTGRLPGLELTELKLSDPKDLAAPVTFRYRVNVPNYAMRTSKRILLSPAFFETNRAARFATAKRKYDIYFRYPWSEIDDISITLPEGYQLDHAEAPGALAFAPMGHYGVRIFMPAPNRLLYHRELVMGDNGMLTC